MTNTEEPTIDQLFARMLRTTYYVCEGDLLAPMADVLPHLRAHLLYMIGLEKQGVLFASGPFIDDSGTNTGGGMAIVRARDHAHALQIASDDPMVKAGVRSVSVRRWVVNEGAMTVTVHFSDGTGIPG